eukprot:gene22153-29215_t
MRQHDSRMTSRPLPGWGRLGSRPRGGPRPRSRPAPPSPQEGEPPLPTYEHHAKCKVCSAVTGRDVIIKAKSDALTKHETGQALGYLKVAVTQAQKALTEANAKLAAATREAKVAGIAAATASAKVVEAAAVSSEQRAEELLLLQQEQEALGKEGVAKALVTLTAMTHAAAVADVKNFDPTQQLSQHQKNKLKYDKMEDLKKRQPTMDHVLGKSKFIAFQTKLPQFQTVNHTLRHGRPLVAYPQARELDDARPDLKESSHRAFQHRSYTSGWSIARSIDHVVRMDMIKAVKRSVRWSVSLDEATDNTNKTLLCVLGKEAGISLADLASRLICVGCDGASVLQGARKGLVTRLRQGYCPYIASVHCYAHRGNLVAKVLDTMTEVAELDMLLRSTYNFFCRSSLRTERLASFQDWSGGDVMKLLKDVHTRWLSHLAPAQRLFNQWPVVAALFDDTSCGKGDVRVQAEGLLQDLLRMEKLINMAVILPLLRTLDRFVKTCQKADITVQELDEVVGAAQDMIRSQYFGAESFSEQTDFREFFLVTSPTLMESGGSDDEDADCLGTTPVEDLDDLWGDDEAMEDDDGVGEDDDELEDTDEDEVMGIDGDDEDAPLPSDDEDDLSLGDDGLPQNEEDVHEVGVGERSPSHWLRWDDEGDLCIVLEKGMLAKSHPRILETGDGRVVLKMQARDHSAKARNGCSTFKLGAVNGARLKQAIAEAKVVGAEAAQLVMSAVEDRFPPREMLQAFSMLEPRFRVDGGISAKSTRSSATRKEMAVRLRYLMEYYGLPKTVRVGRGKATDVSPVIDQKKLKDQWPAFVQFMERWSPIMLGRHAAAVASQKALFSEAKADGKKRLNQFKHDGRSASANLWTEAAKDAGTSSSISEFIELALISHVMVGGCVQCETLFSHLKFVKDDLRSRLKEEHLNPGDAVAHQYIFVVHKCKVEDFGNVALLSMSLDEHIEEVIIYDRMPLVANR